MTAAPMLSYHSNKMPPLKDRISGTSCLWRRFGYIHVENLDKLPNVTKRLDEWRETFNDLSEKTDIFTKNAWAKETMLKLDRVLQSLVSKRAGCDEESFFRVYHCGHIRNIPTSYGYIPVLFEPKTWFAWYLYKRWGYIHSSELADKKKLTTLLSQYYLIIDEVIKNNYFAKEPWVIGHMDTARVYFEWVLSLIQNE